MLYHYGLHPATVSVRNFHMVSRLLGGSRRERMSIAPVATVFSGLPLPPLPFRAMNSPALPVTPSPETKVHGTVTHRTCRLETGQTPGTVSSEDRVANG